MKSIPYNPINFYKIFLTGFILTLSLWLFPYLFGKYVDTSFPFIPEKDIPVELIGMVEASEKGLNWCPHVSPHLEGRDFKVHEKLDKDEVEETVADSLSIQAGGVWQPLQCRARYEVVIILPIRNRENQLRQFLLYMHPFLQRQQLYYRIIAVEQEDTAELFNRARLFNIGFTEALSLGAPNACFIFHDVDLIPENDFNIYSCTHNPRHMYSSLDVFRYHLPYRNLMGGAIAILPSHFEEVNGFSNLFYGWGGEDDDFSVRLREKGLVFERFDPRVARYTMMHHPKEIPSRRRWEILSESVGRVNAEDGLSSLRYTVVKVDFFPLYTRMLVE